MMLTATTGIGSDKMAPQMMGWSGALKEEREEEEEEGEEEEAKVLPLDENARDGGSLRAADSAATCWLSWDPHV